MSYFCVVDFNRGEWFDRYQAEYILSEKQLDKLREELFVLAGVSIMLLVPVRDPRL